MTPITSGALPMSERSGRRFELWTVRHKLSQRCPAVVAACHLKEETINTESRFTQTTGNDTSERGADFWPITFPAGSRALHGRHSVTDTTAPCEPLSGLHVLFSQSASR